MRKCLTIAAASFIAAAALSDSPARAQCPPTISPGDCIGRMLMNSGSQRQAVPPVDYYLQQQRLRDIEDQQRQQQLQLDALRRQQTIDRINTPCVPVSAWRC